jgi:hypothetical protein
MEVLVIVLAVVGIAGVMLAYLALLTVSRVPATPVRAALHRALLGLTRHPAPASRS